ncbi:hypothetical protein AAG906_013920 [Vitis piasezkii]
MTEDEKEDGSDGNTIVNTSEAITVIRQCKSLKQLHQVHAHTITTGLLWGLHHSSLSSYRLCPFSLQSHPKPINLWLQHHDSSSHLLSSLSLHLSSLSACAASLSHRTLTPFLLPQSLLLLPALSLAQTLHSQAFKFGFGADLFVCNTLIHVYSVNKHLHHACQVFNETSLKDVVSYNALIGGFIKVGDTDRARRLFDEMPIRDAVSWGTLLAGYAQSGDLCMDAIQLFNRMLISTVRPDNIALVSALSACAQLGELEQGKSIHVYIKQNRIPINAFLSTGLVDLYAKCGCIETAREIFESSPDKNLFTWNALLVGLGMHGRGHLSLHYFSRMIEAGIKPDGVSFLGILVGCGHAGLMEVVYRVPRELKHYGCMADLLGQAGLIREAMEMIERMPMGRCVCVGGVLGGCRIHGNVEIAEKAAENVMALNPEDDGVYSIMADIYANAGRWEDVARIRRLMHSRQGVHPLLTSLMGWRRKKEYQFQASWHVTQAWNRFASKSDIDLPNCRAKLALSLYCKMMGFSATRGNLRSMVNRLRGSHYTFATSTSPKMRAYAPCRLQQRPTQDFVPVYVAMGMIAMSVTLGLCTAMHELMYSPAVEDPDTVVDEGDKFVKKSLLRKVAHVQELELVPHPIEGDPLTRPPRAVTLKSVGIDPKSH